MPAAAALPENQPGESADSGARIPFSRSSAARCVGRSADPAAMLQSNAGHAARPNYIR